MLKGVWTRVTPCGVSGHDGYVQSDESSSRRFSAAGCRATVRRRPAAMVSPATLCCRRIHIRRAKVDGKPFVLTARAPANVPMRMETWRH